MSDFEELSDKLQKLMTPRETKFGELTNGLTISSDGDLIFLTNVFIDGALLGFWSHSPWGTCHNQEQGWAVFSKDLEMLDSCETKTSGQSAGNDFRKWRKKQSELHGKSFKLKAEWDTEQFWKLSDT